MARTSTTSTAPAAMTSDDAVQAGRDFMAAIDARTEVGTRGPTMSLDAEVEQLAAAWSVGGPTVTDELRAAVAAYVEFWNRFMSRAAVNGDIAHLDTALMRGQRIGIATAVDAALVEHDRTLAGDPGGAIAAAEQQVAQLETDLADAEAALADAVAASDIGEALRLRGPARVELPAALAAARLRLLDAQLEQRNRARTPARERAARAADASQAAQQAVKAAHQQVIDAVAAAQEAAQYAQTERVLDNNHSDVIAALRTAREHLVASQAAAHAKRQRDLAALTA
jgi:hypothetical protein